MLDDSWYLTEILKHGGDVNLVNPVNGRTPIFDALNAARTHNVTILIAAGTNLNVFDRLHQTPPMVACATQRIELLYDMLIAGADPTVRDPAGITLLSYIRRSMVPRSDPWMAKVIDNLKATGLDVDSAR